MSRNFRILFYKARESWLVYPVPPEENLKYLIEAPSEKEAVAAAQAILEGRLKAPLEDSTFYQPAELHTDGSTLIFALKTNVS